MNWVPLAELRKVEATVSAEAPDLEKQAMARVQKWLCHRQAALEVAV